MIKYSIFFLSALLLSYLITPLVRLLAIKLKILDIPSERKIHKKPTPLLGGIPIFLSFNLVVFLGVTFQVIVLKETMLAHWREFVLCQVLVLAIGIYDDIKKLQPRTKFLFQILAGELVIISGFFILAVKNPFSGKTIELGYWSIPVTILWVVGITNALNLVDGLDGLAAGIALISAAAVFGIALLNQTIVIAIIASVFIGSILGFLRYNFPPAKIFLGDSGSLFLGFLLSVLSVQGSFKGAIVVTVLAPILALGLPIMDTFLSMIRRFLASIKLVQVPEKNGEVKVQFFRKLALFQADKNHIHHRLIGFGFSQKKSVLILYLVGAVLCALAFLSVVIANVNTTLFLAAIVVSIFIGIRNLKYEEFRILEKGVFLPLFNTPWLNRKFFLVFLDLAFVSIAYYLSFHLLLRDFSVATKKFFLLTLPVILVVKLACFYLGGLYKGSWKYAGLEDVIRIMKGVGLASVVSLVIKALAFGLNSYYGPVFFILDFYILLSFVGASRISYRILDSYYVRHPRGGKKGVLIYGAGRRSLLLVKEIKRSGGFPLGFLDDDPRKKGQIQQGYPVLGGVDELERLIDRNDIREIVLATPKIAKERRAFLIAFCREQGIEIKQFDFLLKPIIE